MANNISETQGCFPHRANYSLSAMALSAISRAVILSAVFLGCVSFSIVMPTLWPYLNSLHAGKSFLACVIAMYSVGEAIGALYFGWLATKVSTRRTTIFSTCVGVVGSVLYCIAGSFPQYKIGACMVLVGRLTQGVWSGAAQAVQQAHLAKALPVNQLTGTTVMLNAYACFGFVVGPVFGLVFDILPQFRIPYMGLSVNELSIPGYFVLLSTIVTVVMYMFLFEDIEDASSTTSAYCFQSESVNSALAADCFRDFTNGYKKAEHDPHILRHHEKSGAGLIAASERNSLLGKEERRSSFSESSYLVPMLVCNGAFFTHFVGFALQETVTTYVLVTPI